MKEADYYYHCHSDYHGDSHRYAPFMYYFEWKPKINERSIFCYRCKDGLIYKY